MYLLESIDLEGKPKFIFVDGEKIVKAQLKPLMKEVVIYMKKLKHGKIIAAMLTLIYYCTLVIGNVLRVFSILTRTKEKFKERAEYKLKCCAAQLNGLILSFSLNGIYIDDIIERAGEVEIKELDI